MLKNAQPGEQEMIRIVVAIGVMALAGCATPAGQLTDADFSWEERTVAATPAEIERRLMLGLRTCGVSVPECFLADHTRHLVCDVYAGGGIGVRKSDIVIGRIRVEALDAGTSRVRAGLQPVFRRPWDKRIPSWLAFAGGNTACID